MDQMHKKTSNDSKIVRNLNTSLSKIGKSPSFSSRASTKSPPKNVPKKTIKPIRKEKKEARGKKANNLSKQKEVLDNNYKRQRDRLAELESKWKTNKKSLS